jgi:protein SCO1/2
MTMVFALQSPQLAQGLAPGSRIEMQLQTGQSWTIVGVRSLPPEEGPTEAGGDTLVEAPPASPRPGELYFQLGVGQQVPEFRLITQGGRPLALSQLRGKVVVLSFIYTRCPLPQICPMIVRHLVRLQSALSGPERQRTHILLVTIDPKHDTPEVLQRYAVAQGLELDHATLLTGPIRQVALLSSYFGLEFYDEADGTIAHKQRLVVIDPQGRVHAELKGPSWTDERVLALIRQALAEGGAVDG